jgi:Uma2 family endonuclease
VAVSTQAKTFLTPEQYLEIERKTEERNEYWRGEMFAMSGNTREHNLLAANVLASLHQQLRKKPCEVYPSHMRVFIPTTGLYTYPDVVAVCGEPRFAPDDYLDNLLNPTFLAEILSPSTEAYDRGRKFEQYQTVESLREYLLVAQDRMHVDLYTRQADRTWLLRSGTRPEDTIEVQSIGCRVLLADLYEKVTLPE